MKSRRTRTNGPRSQASQPKASRIHAFRNALIGLFCFSLFVRAIYLYEIRSIGFFQGLMSDAYVYNERAVQIAEGDWLGPADFVHAPLYAYLLGILRIIGFTDLLTPRIVQIIFGAASCCLLASMARRVFDDRTALVAGLLFAVYPPAIFFDGQVQKTSLASFLAILLLWQMVISTEMPTGRHVAFCGLTTGLLILTQQSSLILVPLLVAWLALNPQSTFLIPPSSTPELRGSHAVQAIPRTRFAIRHSLFFVLALALTLLPWTFRNRAVTGHLTLTTPNLGQNFFMGNSEKATGTYLPQSRSRSTGEYEQEDWTVAAETALGRPLSLAEVSDYYLHMGLDFIRNHPAAWLRLSLKKWMMTWNAYEAADTEDYYLYLEHSALLRCLDVFFHFGVLCPLAAAGVVLTWSQRRRLWPLYAWAVLSTVAVAAFVVFARYRFPLIPIVVLFAAAAIVIGFDRIRHRRIGELRWPIVAAACAALASNWPVFLHRKTYPRSYINHSNALAQQDRYDEAVGELQKALAISADEVDALVTLGSTLVDMSRTNDAIATLQKAESVSPGDSEVIGGLVAANLAAGRFGEAANDARRALAIDPDDFRAKTGLATAMARNGNAAQAIELFQEVLRRRPKHVATHINLGNTYIAVGRPDDAVRCWEAAIRLRRDHPDALNNLAVLEMTRGHTDRAVELFKRLVQVAPSRPGAQAAYEAALRAQKTARKSPTSATSQTAN